MNGDYNSNICKCGNRKNLDILLVILVTILNTTKNKNAKGEIVMIILKWGLIFLIEIIAPGTFTSG
jgi:hypothetical protein